MKRVKNIIWLWIVLYYPLYSQITSINGELRYDHQYQDAKSSSLYSSYVRKNPQLVLGTSGYIYSPYIASFSLRTSLNASYNSANSGGLFYSSKQYFFNFYDLNLDVLTNYVLKFNFSARDARVESNNNLYNFGSGLSKYRQQQQGFSVSTERISFLPTTNFVYRRTHNWSEVPFINFNETQNEYNLNFVSAGLNSSVSVNGSLNDSYEKFSGRSFKYFLIRLNGNKEFDKNRRMDVNAEYYKYDNSMALSGSGVLAQLVGEKFRMNSTLSARNFTTSSSYAFFGGLGQNVQYLYNENFNFFLNMNGQVNQDIYKTENVQNKNYDRNLGSSFSFSHMRNIAPISFSNNVSVSYSHQSGSFASRSTSVGLNNSIQSSYSDFNISGNQEISYSRVRGYLGREEINNSANITVSGILPYNIHSQTGIDYRDERLLNNLELRRKLRMLRFQQQLNTSMYYYIPFSIGLSGNVNMSLNNNSYQTYGWNLYLSSSNFFLTNLTMGYRFSWTSNPYNQRNATIEQAAEFTYQWRALSFQLRLQEFRYIDRRREIWFSVTRPFNIGL